MFIIKAAEKGAGIWCVWDGAKFDRKTLPELFPTRARALTALNTMLRRYCNADDYLFRVEPVLRVVT